ncbi:MAG: endo-1,4-beta-xylanase [Phycisphaerae bacterium]
MRNFTTLIVCALLGMIFLSQPAYANPWDAPESAAAFEGELVGKVKWVPNHTNNWFVFIVDEAKPAEGDAATHTDIADKTVRIAVGKWLSPTRPDPALEGFVRSLKPNQALTINVIGQPDKTFRFDQVPAGHVPAGGADAGGAANDRIEAATTENLDAYHRDLHFNELNGLPKLNWLLGKTQADVYARNNWSLQRIGGSAEVSLIDVEGQPFPKALRIEVKEAADPGWKIHAQFPGDSPVAEGDVLFGVMYLRVTEAAGPYGEVFFRVEQEKAWDPNGWKHLVQQTIQPAVGEAWQRIYFAGEVKNDTTVKMPIFVGYQKQTVEIGGLTLVNLGPDVSIDDLPTNEAVLDYQGREPDAEWRASADERIDRYRKADLTVKVQDAAGNPVPAAAVTVKQQRHAFGFGTAADAFKFKQDARHRTSDFRSVFYLDDENGRQYRQHLAGLFNTVTTGPNWRVWEYRPEQSMEHLQNLREMGLDVFIHGILYPRSDQVPDRVKSMPDVQQAADELFASVREVVPAVGEPVSGFDVINEMFGSKYFEQRFPTREAYLDFVANLFKLVGDLDSDARLYINEAHLASPTSHLRRQYTLDIVSELTRRGAPVHGIGVQGHVGIVGEDWHPQKLYDVFDELSVGGKYKVQISEHDALPAGGSAAAYARTGEPDNEIARYEADLLRDMLTITFSHPHAEGFTLWGFWDGCHWKDNAPLFYEDWTPKPALTVWKDLTQKAWWTNENTRADAAGTATVRAFKGSHEVRVEHNGRTATATVKLTDDQTVTVTLK